MTHVLNNVLNNVLTQVFDSYVFDFLMSSLSARLGVVTGLEDRPAAVATEFGVRRVEPGPHQLAARSEHPVVARNG